MAAKDANSDPVSVMIFGLKNTGKTCLLSVLAGEEPTTDYNPTTNFADKTITFQLGKNNYAIKFVCCARVTRSGRSRGTFLSTAARR